MFVRHGTPGDLGILKNFEEVAEMVRSFSREAGRSWIRQHVVVVVGLGDLFG